MSDETYHGHKISYSDGGDPEAPSLRVDGQDYEVIVHSDGTFSARERYYEKFGSLVALGRSIARQLPD